MAMIARRHDDLPVTFAAFGDGQLAIDPAVCAVADHPDAPTNTTGETFRSRQPSR
jgi:hypothetical protein